jgi:hypothetical protein
LAAARSGGRRHGPKQVSGAGMLSPQPGGAKRYPYAPYSRRRRRWSWGGGAMRSMR